MAVEEVSVPFEFRTPFYSSITRVVHIYILNLVADELKWANDELQEIAKERRRDVQQPSRSECKGIKSFVYGYPCRHKLRDLKEDSLTLQPHHFHRHWWIDRFVTPEALPTLLLDFAIRPPRKF